MVWQVCGKYMWYRMDHTNQLNFPAQWARYEVAYPCPEDQRGIWAAVSPVAGAAHSPKHPPERPSTI